MSDQIQDDKPSREINLTTSIDGYEIDITTNLDRIQSELKRHEDEEYFAKEGPEILDLSKFAQIKATPTDDKWDELTERLINTE